MEILRHAVVLVHLTGFAILFGSWFVEAVARRVRFTRVMEWGLAVAGLAGLALAAPWGTDADMNYAKIGTKLVILLIIGALLGIGSARQKRDKGLPPVMFWLVGILTLGNAAIALLWR